MPPPALQNPLSKSLLHRTVCIGPDALLALRFLSDRGSYCVLLAVFASELHLDRARRGGILLGATWLSHLGLLPGFDDGLVLDLDNCGCINPCADPSSGADSVNINKLVRVSMAQMPGGQGMGESLQWIPQMVRTSQKNFSRSRRHAL